MIFSATGPVTITATSNGTIPDTTAVNFRITSSGRTVTSSAPLAGGSATVTVTVPKGVGTIQATATYDVP